MRIAVAIAVSVLVHLVLAAGLWWYLKAGPSSIVLAQLDLSSVELSLAEEEVATAVPVAALPAEAVAESPADRPPPKAPPPPVPAADDPTAPALPEPRPPEVAAAAPDLPEVRKQVRPDPPRPPAVAPTSPAAAPKQARVDAPPSPKRAITPDYPRGSRIRKEEGDVVLEICVAASGDVSGVSVVGSSGFAALDEAAVRAAESARFTPAKSGAEAVASVARLKLRFRLK